MPIKFCSEAYFYQACGSLMSQKSQTRDPPSLKSFLKDLCSGFLRPEKNSRLQPGLKLQTLDLEVSMLPRDHQGRHIDQLLSF